MKIEVPSLQLSEVQACPAWGKSESRPKSHDLDLDRDWKLVPIAPVMREDQSLGQHCCDLEGLKLLCLNQVPNGPQKVATLILEAEPFRDKILKLRKLINQPSAIDPSIHSSASKPS